VKNGLSNIHNTKQSVGSHHADMLLQTVG